MVSQFKSLSVQATFTLTLAFFASACGSSPAKSVAPASPTIFEGQFESACAGVGGGLYLKVLITNHNNSTVQSISYHQDAGANLCLPASRIALQEKTSTFSVGDDYASSITGGEVANKTDLTTVSVYLTVYNNGTTDQVTAQSGSTGCPALGAFVAGVAKDVTGTMCGADGGTHPTVGQVAYTFFDLHTSASPNELYFGDPDADPGLDGTTDLKRPVATTGIFGVKI